MIDMEQTKQHLEKQKALLEAKIVEIDTTLREPHSADWEDHATEVEGEEVLEDMGNRLQREIQEFGQALERIELGTYGQCTHCSEPIGEKRLEIMPAAAHCIKCEASL